MMMSKMMITITMKKTMKAVKITTPIHDIMISQITMVMLSTLMIMVTKKKNNTLTTMVMREPIGRDTKMRV